MDFATPYESPDYSTLDVLSMLDVLWGKMEAGFRYLKWNIEIRKNEYDDKVYCFYRPLTKNTHKRFSCGCFIITLCLLKKTL